MAKKYSKGAHVMSLAMPSHQPHGLDKYEVEDAARTMKKHHEIKSNKKLHRAAKMHLKKEHAAMAKALKEK